jgi:CheY-like chemotaxis protein
MSIVISKRSTANANRILVADDESLLGQRLAEFLSSKGFATETVRSGSELEAALVSFQPQFILYDLMLPELNALQFLQRMASSRASYPGLKVFVLSGHSNQTNIRECMRLGAADYISKPVSHDALLARIILYLQPKREVTEFQAKSAADFEGALFYLHLTDLLLREANKGLPVPGSLHNLSGLLGVTLKAVRVSIVHCDVEARKGRVMASSDKRSINGLEIDLNRYPEIQYVLTNEKLLAVDNLAADPTMHFVTLLEKSINFNSMVVAPIRIKGDLWGVLSARMPESKKKLNEFEIRFCQLAAHVVGMVLQRDLAYSFITEKSENDGEAATFDLTALVKGEITGNLAKPALPPSQTESSKTPSKASGSDPDSDSGQPAA